MLLEDFLQEVIKIKSLNIKVILLLVVLVLAVGVALSKRDGERSKVIENTPTPQAIPTPENEITLGSDPLNISYEVGGTVVKLVDGEYEGVIPGSAAKVVTSVWDVYIDSLTQEGRDDAAVILVQNPGGSGTFYYIAAGIDKGDGYLGTNAIFLGDRIAMQTVEIDNMQIIVNYTDNVEGDSMADGTSVGVSKWFVVDGDKLIEAPKPNL